MKIIPYEILKNTEHQKTGTNKQTTGDMFREILQETIIKSTNPEERTMTSPPVQNISNIQFNSIPNINKTQNVEQVEHFLNVLDVYNKKLGDPTSTLKDIYPLVTTMESETDKILPFLDSLSDEDELKDVLNRAVITATVEAIKFNRGDYL
ncbi:MAG: hypothetical protein JXC33_02220 [Deltaproteobacteria bacterium]|nr:hypothetical protein [Deltaproteobacteria bacterium]